MGRSRTAFDRFRLAAHRPGTYTPTPPSSGHTHVVIEDEQGGTVHVATDDGALVWLDQATDGSAPPIDHGPTLPSIPPGGADVGHVVIEHEDGTRHVITDDGLTWFER